MLHLFLCLSTGVIDIFGAVLGHQLSIVKSGSQKNHWRSSTAVEKSSQLTAQTYFIHVAT